MNEAISKIRERIQYLTELSTQCHKSAQFKVLTRLEEAEYILSILSDDTELFIQCYLQENEK